MAAKSVHRTSGGAWRLARVQHGVISAEQLEGLGYRRAAVRHRVEHGRLHLLYPGVYAVGRPEVTQHGRLMAAVLACGPGAVLSHLAASVLWAIHGDQGSAIDVTIHDGRRPRARGIRIHRRRSLPQPETTRCRNIPVTSPALTIVDIAPRLTTAQLEAAINEADKLDLIDPVRLRERIDKLPRVPGLAIVRRCLDRHTFVLTDSELERRFLRLVRAAGLPPPVTGAELNGFRVDFHWPTLGLVVETDGLRYHRTPTQQSRDRRRDQAHARAGLTTLRFTHFQVRFEPEEVGDTLAAVAARLAAVGSLSSGP